MAELRKLGVEIHLFPLLRGGENVSHPEVLDFSYNAHYCDVFSFLPLKAHLLFLAKRPLAYANAWRMAIRGNITSPKFLSRALAVMYKAPYFALQAEKLGIKRIHAHWATHPSLCAMIVKRLSGTSFSMTIHAHDLFVERPMLRRKILESAATVSISEFNKSMLNELYGLNVAERVKVIHLGVDLDRFDPPECMSVVPPFRMACVASLEEYKGHDILLEACAILARKKVPFMCECIGDGPKRREIVALTEKKRLGGRVSFTGAKPWTEVRDALAVSNCIVLPSIIERNGKTEGIPVSLMEGLAMKLPAVASNLSGIPELIEDGENGFLVAPGDPVALADALEILYLNPDMRLRMGERGRRAIEQKFDLSRNVRQLYRLLAM